MSSARRQGSRLPILGQPARTPERRDARENRVRILAAARRLLAEEPMESISLDRLAKEAGVGKGTLFRRFSDRSSLVRALLDEEATTLQADVLNGFGLGPEVPWRHHIEQFLEALLDFTLANLALLCAALASERGGHERYDHPAYAWQREALTAYLRKAVANREIAPLDATVTAERLLAGLDPGRVAWLLREGHSADALRASFRDFHRRVLSATSVR